MAAPTKVTRQVPPAGSYLMPDGFKTTVAMANIPAMLYWEQTVKPPGYDGGDPINITNMLNTAYRTMHPPTLITVGPEMTSNVFVDADVIPQIRSNINAIQAITVALPNGGFLTFWGHLRKFEPGEHKEKEAPIWVMTICIDNWDPVNYAEAGPVYQAPAGTL